MKTTLLFDKEDLYDEKIAPLVKQIYDICFDNKMPFFIAVTVKTSENGPAVLRRDGFCARTFNKDINGDEIGKHLAVSVGFNVNGSRVDTEEKPVIPAELFDEPDLGRV